jgi:hypothetical protein
MLQQQQPFEDMLGKDESRLSKCLLLLHAYAASVEACPQHPSAYSSESIAAVATVLSWSQQQLLSRGPQSTDSSKQKSTSALRYLTEFLWTVSVFLMTLLLIKEEEEREDEEEDSGSASVQTENLPDQAVHAVDSTGVLPVHLASSRQLYCILCPRQVKHHACCSRSHFLHKTAPPQVALFHLLSHYICMLPYLCAALHAGLFTSAPDMLAKVVDRNARATWLALHMAHSK